MSIADNRSVVVARTGDEVLLESKVNETRWLSSFTTIDKSRPMVDGMVVVVLVMVRVVVVGFAVVVVGPVSATPQYVCVKGLAGNLL